MLLSWEMSVVTSQLFQRLARHSFIALGLGLALGLLASGYFVYAVYNHDPNADHMARIGDTPVWYWLGRLVLSATLEIAVPFVAIYGVVFAIALWLRSKR
ncbi:MAG: hypothetical protein V4597_19960 [Pseudomonadota bacterium]